MIVIAEIVNDIGGRAGRTPEGLVPIQKPQREHPQRLAARMTGETKRNRCRIEEGLSFGSVPRAGETIHTHPSAGSAKNARATKTR